MTADHIAPSSTPQINLSLGPSKIESDLIVDGKVIDDITYPTPQNADRDASIRRTMSDPTQDVLKEGLGAKESCDGSTTSDGSSITSHVDEPYPTLSRFNPNENLNCWSESTVDMFHVRGPEYLVDKSKIPSQPFLMKARGCDLMLTDKPPVNIGMNSSILGGALRKEPTFLLNFRFPWGVMVLYFEIPAKMCPFLKPEAVEDPPSMEGFTVPEKTLANFLMADEKEKNERLKLIPFVTEGPWVVRKLVTGTPSIIGTKLPVTYTYEPATDGMAEYLEADLDIGNSSATAKQIVSMCRRFMNSLTVDIGFVIQGNSPEELPEQMLGSVRIHGVDPSKAPTI